MKESTYQHSGSTGRILFVAGYGGQFPDQLPEPLMQIQRCLSEHGSWTTDKIDASCHSAAQMPGAFDKVGAMARRICESHIVHIIDDGHMPILSGSLAALMLARFYGRKTIYHYCRPDGIVHVEKIQAMAVWVMGRADLIVVDSEAVAAVLEKRSVNALYVAPTIADHVICSRNLTALQPDIVVCGPLESFRNVGAAICAFQIVKEKYPRSELTIIGEGSKQKHFETIIARQRIAGVSFVGECVAQHRSNLVGKADLYLDLSVPGSRADLMLEAMACGLPVVAAKGGVAHPLIRDGENGYLVSADRPGAAADAIIGLVESNETVSRLSAAASKTAQNLSTSKAGGQWAEIYKSILSRSQKVDPSLQDVIALTAES
ncbi:MAG: glycosyltransferase family 4 protein [Candidatus Zixiibacteriota bacterium]